MQDEAIFNHSILRTLRKEMGLSAEHVAKAIGLSCPTYLKRESGDVPLSVPQVRRLADLYECPVEMFFVNSEIDVSLLSDRSKARASNIYDLERIELLRDAFRYSVQFVSDAIGRSAAYYKDRMNGFHHLSREDVRRLARLYSIPEYVLYRSYDGSIEKIIQLSELSFTPEVAVTSADPLRGLLHILSGLDEKAIRMLQVFAKVFSHPYGRDKLFSALTLPRSSVEEILDILFPNGYVLTSHQGNLSQEECAGMIQDLERYPDIQLVFRGSPMLEVALRNGGALHYSISPSYIQGTSYLELMPKTEISL
jgi:transcriptional regulator with XRE-family HTH domain